MTTVWYCFEQLGSVSRSILAAESFADGLTSHWGGGLGASSAWVMTLESGFSLSLRLRLRSSGLFSKSSIEHGRGQACRASQG